jgi:prepilin-type N-terminal cleavage/methylation domain-containing protein
MKTNSRGFTLVELLMVVAIIAMLELRYRDPLPAQITYSGQFWSDAGHATGFRIRPSLHNPGRFEGGT